MIARKISLCIAIFLLVGISAAQAQNQTIRIATYNIEWFGGHPSTPQRMTRLQTLIAHLQADVIGLEEIGDRAALRQIFPADQWQIVIDDQSSDTQNLALAIHLPFRVAGSAGNSNDIDASDANFLFPNDDPATDSLFPNQRDILFETVQVPNSAQTFVVMVDHAKSRGGGRAATDPRREGAARMIVQAIQSRFSGQAVVLLGDFNDNPDDPSINILETGNANAAPGPDDSSDDSFLVNLSEPLLAQDHVSWGLSEDDIQGNLLDSVNSGSRVKNNQTRGGDGVIAPILFDQILVSPTLLSQLTLTSIQVFDDPIAQEGNPRGENPEGNPIGYASDHTPVIAEFALGASPATVQPPPVVVTQPSSGGDVRIIQLLPNPVGADEGHETVTLRNLGDQAVTLTGWTLVDRAGNVFPLDGTLAGGEQRVIPLPSGSLPLNNNGDDVTLFSADGTQRDHVSYGQAASGVAISFGS